MRTSNQVLAIGVGVFVAFGQALPGVSQSTQESVTSEEKIQAADSKQPNAQPNSREAVATTKVSTPREGTVNPPTKSISSELELRETEAGQPVNVTASDLTAKLQPKFKAAQVSALKSSTRAAQASTRSPQLKNPISLTDFKSQQTQVAQATPTPGINSPATTPSTINIAPGSSGIFAPNSGIVQSQPIGPAKTGDAPDYLNPNPNPLYFPTQPEDVRLRGIQPITLEQALELAKRNNRDLQIAARQLERSQASLREAEADLYPSVTAQGSLTQSRSATSALSQAATRQATGGLGGNNETVNRTLNGTVGLSYDIFTSGERPARIRAAERQIRSDQLQVEINEQQIRLDVSGAYYNLQEADEAVRIQAAAVRNAEASLRDTQALERAGLGTRFDVLRAQVQLANARQDLTNARANQQVRRRELAQVLALPPSIDLAAADPVEAAGQWNLTLPQTIVLAFKNRAELEQQLAQRELAEQQRRVALSALGPRVTLQAQYNVLNDLRDNQGFADGYSVSAGFNWNLFDGGAARARANQQEANIRIAETRFAQARENIQLQVETSFTNLQSSFLNIGTSRQAVEQAREALRLARLRFQAGVGTQTDVINAENDLTRAEGNLITAILGYNRALASLQRSVTNLPIPTRSTTPSIPAPATGAPSISTPTPPAIQ